MVTLHNIYEDAGQTIPHCHIHIIPRYKAMLKMREVELWVLPSKKSIDWLVAILIELLYRTTTSVAFILKKKLLNHNLKKIYFRIKS
jgi:hypothetical protein